MTAPESPPPAEIAAAPYDLTMMRRLANHEDPYGTGPFDSDHIEIYQAAAKRLVDELDLLRAAVTSSPAEHAVEWGARWDDGGYCPATPPRSEDFARNHARNFGTRPIRRQVGPWVYADTGELAFPEQADRGIAAGEDQL